MRWGQGMPLTSNGYLLWPRSRKLDAYVLAEGDAGGAKQVEAGAAAACVGVGLDQDVERFLDGVRRSQPGRVVAGQGRAMREAERGECGGVGVGTQAAGQGVGPAEQVLSAGQVACAQDGADRAAGDAFTLVRIREQS